MTRFHCGRSDLGHAPDQNKNERTDHELRKPDRLTKLEHLHRDWNWGRLANRVPSVILDSGDSEPEAGMLWQRGKVVFAGPAGTCFRSGG